MTWEWALLAAGIVLLVYAMIRTASFAIALEQGKKIDANWLPPTAAVILGACLVSTFSCLAGKNYMTPDHIGNSCVAAVRLEQPRLDHDMLKQAQLWERLVDAAGCRSPSGLPAVTLNDQPVAKK